MKILTGQFLDGQFLYGVLPIRSTVYVSLIGLTLHLLRPVWAICVSNWTIEYDGSLVIVIRLGISDKKRGAKEDNSDLLLFYLYNLVVYNKLKAISFVNL